MVEPVEEGEKEADEEADVGKAPPLATQHLNRRQHRGQFCLQRPDFGRVVQMTRWPGESWQPVQGPGVRFLLYRQSSHPLQR